MFITPEIDFDDKLANLYPLHYAASIGNVDDIVKLCHLNPSLASTPIGESRHTPLMFAAYHDQYQAIRALFSFHVSADDVDANQFTALHWAASKASTRTGDLLITQGASLNSINSEMETPLSRALVQKNYPFCLFLIEKGAATHYRNVQGQYPLNYAISHNYRNISIALIENDAPLETLSLQKYTPLLQAASSANDTVCEALIKKGANIRYVHPSNKNTACHYFATHGKTHLLKRAFKAGAFFDCPDNEGFLPIHYAAQYACFNTLQYLHSMVPRSVDSLSKRGFTPLASVIILYSTFGSNESIARRRQIVTYLLNHHANPNALTDQGVPLIIKACEIGDVYIVEALLKAGADPYVSNQQGQTCVHLAVSAGNNALLKLLSKHHANLNARNVFHQTPLSLAHSLYLYSTFMTLLELNAVPSLPPSTIFNGKPENYKYAKALLEYGAFPDGRQSPLSTLASIMESPMYLVIAHGGNVKTAQLLLDFGASTILIDTPDMGLVAPRINELLHKTKVLDQALYVSLRTDDYLSLKAKFYNKDGALKSKAPTIRVRDVHYADTTEKQNLLLSVMRIQHKNRLFELLSSHYISYFSQRYTNQIQHSPRFREYVTLQENYPRLKFIYKLKPIRLGKFGNLPLNAIHRVFITSEILDRFPALQPEDIKEVIKSLCMLDRLAYKLVDQRLNAALAIKPKNLHSNPSSTTASMLPYMQLKATCQKDHSDRKYFPEHLKTTGKRSSDGERKGNTKKLVNRFSTR